jgi:predicted nicotinamide N-methyase
VRIRPRAVMGDDGWRRAALDYRSKFEEDFVFAVPGARAGAPPLRIAQAPSASAAEKRVVVGGAGAGSSRPGHCAERTAPAAEDDDARDPIPATGFTVWDAGVLLGAYVAQPEVWQRLTERAGGVRETPKETEKDEAAGNDVDDEDGDATHEEKEQANSSSRSNTENTVLELGSGTGVAGLALATTGLPSAVALTDLPGLCPFLKHNVVRNMEPVSTSGKFKTGKGKNSMKLGSEPAIPSSVQLAVAPVRWGVAKDVAQLHPKFRNPTVLLGADLAYTENITVIDKLAQTVAWCVPIGATAVFASCREHRPESVDRLEASLLGFGFEKRKVERKELAPGYGRPRVDGLNGDEEIEEDESESDASFRVVEFRRVEGDAMSDTEAARLRNLD